MEGRRADAGMVVDHETGTGSEPFTPSSHSSSRTNEKKKRRILFIVVASLALVGVAFIVGYFVGGAASKATLLLPSPTPFTSSSSSSSAESREEGSHIANALHEEHRPSSWEEAICADDHHPSTGHCPPGFSKSPLILVSMDGFAAHYLDLHQTPSIDLLMHCGAHPPYMNPVFPTKTFPNHYSIVTGLYPAAHGIVDNTMYDPISKKTFSISSPEATKAEWWKGEPIWITAKKQGLRTATYFWPGSDVDGMRADYYMSYNRSIPLVNRVQQVLRWMDEPEDTRPHFVTLYFEEPDASGHRHGPRSSQVKEALRKVDALVSLLLEGLHKRHLLGCANILFVSDHGMAPISCSRVVSLEAMSAAANNSNFSTKGLFFKDGTVGRLRPLQDHQEDHLLQELQDQFQCKEAEEAWVYRQEDFPVRWQYRGNERIDPILFDMKSTWLLSDRINGSENKKFCSGGDHGYDDLNPSMASIFVAVGPAFKFSFESEPFRNIQIYNLMAHLLGIVPAPNNGTMGSLFHLLRDSPPLLLEVDQKSLQSMANDTCFLSSWMNKEPSSNTSGCPSTGSMDGWTGSTDSGEFLSSVMPTSCDPDKGNATSFCVLKGALSAIGYNTMQRRPAWAAFSISPQVPNLLHATLKAPDGNQSRVATEIGWMNDPRLSLDVAPTNCHMPSSVDGHGNLGLMPLLPPIGDGQQPDGGRWISNAIPMYSNFHQRVLGTLWSEVEEWRQRYPHMDLILGPIYDNRSNVPTHYFLLITICADEDNSLPVIQCPEEDNLDVIGFVLPHRPSLPQCWDMDKYLAKHQSSADVITQLTGLEFFAHLTAHASFRLKQKLIQTSQLSFSNKNNPYFVEF